VSKRTTPSNIHPTSFANMAAMISGDGMTTTWSMLARAVRAVDNGSN
jgi:hypothetical protein